MIFLTVCLIFLVCLYESLWIVLEKALSHRMLTYIIHKDQNQLTNQTAATRAKQLGLLVFINTRNSKIDLSSQEQKLTDNLKRFLYLSQNISCTFPGVGLQSDTLSI